MAQTNIHPTAIEWGLRPFRSRYAGSCAACRGKTEPGEQIVKVPTDRRAELIELGYIKVKTYKYLHIACLPILLPAELIAPLVEAARYLADMTHPRWPKDGVGYSRADHAPLLGWLNAGAPRIYAGEAARRLRGYIETQLGGVDSELGAAVLAASNYRPVQVVGGNGGAKLRGSAKLPTDNSAETVATVRCGGKPVTEDKRPGAVRILANGEGLKIEFEAPWDNEQHGQIKDALKARLQGGLKWDGANKVWRASAGSLAGAWDVFDGADVVVTPGAAKRLADALARAGLSSAADLDNVDAAAVADLDDIRKRIAALSFAPGYAPYPYQEAGVAFISKAGGKALVGDEMGLGKTAQALIHIALNPTKTLCVVPAVVAPNWERECELWAPSLSVQRVKKTKDELTGADITIVTYDMARRRQAELAKAGFKAVICDESHYLKNSKAARTQAVLDICEKSRPQTILCLSGTPLVNRPVEFQTTLGLLRPDDFGNWFRFAQRYCDGHYEWVFVAGGRGARKKVFKSEGSSNLGELNKRLRDVMVRRLKADVLTELPAKTHVATPVELRPKERAAYNRAVKAVTDSVDPKEPGAMLQVITAARQAAGVAKTRAAVEWAAEYAEQGQPVLIFAHHESVRMAILDALRGADLRADRIDGKTSQDARQRAVDSFQGGDLDALVISIKAGGVGITLTRSSNVLLVERAWTPGDEQQAEDRAHRIGQTDPVTVRVLISDTDIDADMAELLDAKARVIAAALDGDGELPEDMDIRAELVARWTERAGGKRPRKRKAAKKAKAQAATSAPESAPEPRGQVASVKPPVTEDEAAWEQLKDERAKAYSAVILSDAAPAEKIEAYRKLYAEAQRDTCERRGWTPARFKERCRAEVSDKERAEMDGADKVMAGLVWAGAALVTWVTHSRSEDN